MPTESASDFPVKWDNPADAERYWEHDPVHSPDAVKPLAFELNSGPFVEGFGWGGRPKQVNYYVYFAMDAGLPAEDGSGPSFKVEPARVAEGARRWTDEILPEIQGHIDHYRDTDFESMPNDELATEIERLPEVRLRSGRLHTMVLIPHWLGMRLLIDTYQELIGGDELDAMRLVQGYGNKSMEAGEALWRLSRLAKSLPFVRERLANIDAASAKDAWAELQGETEASSFVEAFRSYLDEFGWRSGGDLDDATWAEDPTVPLTMLRSYMETEGYDPVAERKRLVEEREAATKETLAKLDGNDRRRFVEVLAAAREAGPLLEDHNYFIDQRLYSLPRRLVLACGRRLVSEGLLGTPDDIFYLHVTELVEALRGTSAELQETAARRGKEFAHWKTVTPPAYIGADPPAGRGVAKPQEAVPSERTDELRGTGASAGVARGPARVLAGLHEAERLRPGDVLVARGTLPPWTPLFAIASAIVTETGGVLSHAAVVAREYAIPAVIALPNATRLIRDGQLIEVDGSAGVVRLL